MYKRQRVDHQVVKGQKTLDFTLTVDNKTISGGKVDYKGVNPGENPPTPEVFSKWGWTNSDDKLKLTYTLNINQGHTCLLYTSYKQKTKRLGQKF